VTIWFGGTIWCDKCVRPTHAKIEIQIGLGGKMRPTLPPGWRSLSSDAHLCPKHSEDGPKVVALSKRRRRR
jgi:hypothetical protein